MGITGGGFELRWTNRARDCEMRAGVGPHQKLYRGDIPKAARRTLLFLDEAAGNSVARVSGRVALQVIGLRMNHQRRSVAAEY